MPDCWCRGAKQSWLLPSIASKSFTLSYLTYELLEEVSASSVPGVTLGKSTRSYPEGLHPGKPPAPMCAPGDCLKWML